MSTVDPNLSPVIVVPGGGSASLPDDPAAVLLDAGAPDTVVTLNSSGVGAARTYADVVGDGLDAWLAADPGNPASLRNGIGAMENVLTTRGDLVRGGVGGAAERFAASTANTFVGGDGTDVVSLTAAQARSALGLATVAPLTGTTGWTLRPGVGGATITGGKVRLTAPLLVPDGGWTGVPLAAYPHGIVGRHPLISLDAKARLATFTGGDGNDVFAGFGLRVGSSAVDGFVLQVRGNGTNTFGYAETISTGTTIGFNLGIGRVTIAGGQFWQRVALNNGTVHFYFGTGSAGAEPTTWTELGSSSTMTNVTAASVAYLEFTLGLTGGGSADNVTVEWDNVSASIVGLR